MLLMLEASYLLGVGVSVDDAGLRYGVDLGEGVGDLLLRFIMA
jgi:hypothetical protein